MAEDKPRLTIHQMLDIFVVRVGEWERAGLISEQECERLHREVVITTDQAGYETYPEDAPEARGVFRNALYRVVETLRKIDPGLAEQLRNEIFGKSEDRGR